MILRACALAASLALVLACASSSSPATSPGTSTCDDLVASAQKDLQSALDANATCTTDADCESVGFGASCFDSCSRGIAKSGDAAYKASVDKVDGAQCKQFKDQGCKQAPIPPCTPPIVKCNAGKCS